MNAVAEPPMAQSPSAEAPPSPVTAATSPTPPPPPPWEAARVRPGSRWVADLSASAGAEAPEEMASKEEWEHTYALINHATVATFLMGLPVVPALVMWLVKRKDSTFIEDHGREAVNFQISLVLYWLMAWMIGQMTGHERVWMAVVYALGVLGAVMAASAARHGRIYRYPACLRCFVHTQSESRED